MSLKSKIEAVIYASEEPVTLAQLAGLLGEEAATELEALAAQQAPLALEDAPATLQAVDDAEAGQAEGAEPAAGPDAAVSAAAVDPRLARERERRVREHLRRAIDTLVREYGEADRGIEIREVAGGFRMGTKPEYHDAVRGFVKSLKPALKLTLQALETLAVVAYKQPVTAAEISEIRGVDSAGVLGGLMARKLIGTAGRKQVIGRPMLYKTTKEFLVRFGLRDVSELPSMEEFERMAGELNEQEDLAMEPTGVLIERANARGDADHIREANGDAASAPDSFADDAAVNRADSADENDTTNHAEDAPASQPGATHPISSSSEQDR